jgi:uncharacterized membrane protein
MKISTIFWNGIKAFVPIALTIAILFWIFRSIEIFFGNILRHIIPAQYYFDGLGIIVGFTFIFILGILVNAYLIKRLYAWADKIVKRIPVIKSIYNAIQDLLNFFDKDKQQAQQTVLIETALGKVIGFITRDKISEFLPLPKENDQVLVFIPLSYMVGGITMVVSRQAITPLDWPVDKAMSFILTAGMTGQKV